ncbi:hypothetical protein K438DRAFT_1999467 [Mycena galopus ATCC 62051]|nr:hypothetical protein K438DRAFT_1999467 [Mycena galopus ATCC 62051]
MEANPDAAPPVSLLPLPEAGRCQPGTNRSEFYFFDDGNIFIRPKDSVVIYCVWKSQLIKYSVYFQDMMMAAPKPAGTDATIASAGDGVSEGSPLIIHTTEANLEVFLECIYLQLGPESLKLRPAAFWLMALEVADLMDSSHIKAMAKESLTKSKDLHPVMRLHLGTYFIIADWIEPAFHGLLAIPLDALKIEEINLVGFSVYIILAETKAKIARHRALCALTAPPATHNALCENPTECSAAWAHAWWGETGRQGVAVALVHPAQHIPASAIVASLPDINVNYQMSTACRRLTTAWPGIATVLMREEVFIADAIKELKKFG